MKEITINIPDDIKLIAGIITILYEDVNGDMNLRNKNLDFQTGNMNFDFEIKKCSDWTGILFEKRGEWLYITKVTFIKLYRMR